jgi:hypothetical protein
LSTGNRASEYHRWLHASCPICCQSYGFEDQSRVCRRSCTRAQARLLHRRPARPGKADLGEGDRLRLCWPGANLISNDDGDPRRLRHSVLLCSSGAAVGLLLPLLPDLHPEWPHIPAVTTIRGNERA